MSTRGGPAHFYRERVPAQFNRVFDAEERAAAGGDPTAERMLSAMRSVRASLVVLVKGDGDYALDIEDGHMRACERPGHAPFLTLAHDLESFRVLERESGDSVLGFLGTLAGLEGGEMKLTSQRVQNIHRLEGSLRFALRGRNPFTIVAHFGVASPDTEPTCTIALDEDCYADLRAGRVEPQDAFLSGRIEVRGDTETAFRLALAALSPE